MYRRTHIRNKVSGEEADSSGTTMLGQPMTGLEQAPEPYPLTKICLISKGVHDPRIRY